MKNPKIIKRNDGSVISKIWLTNSKYHRDDGPAIIYFYKNGDVESEYYYLNNEAYRIDGPAKIYYYKSGKIKSQYYYLYGKKFNSLKELQDYNKTLILI